MIGRHWALALVRLYPRAWRRRYGEEMAAILRAQHVMAWTLADLALGAVDAQLHSNLEPEGVLSVGQRVRASEVAIFVAAVVFGAAWLAILHAARDPLSVWEAAAAAHPAMASTFTVIQIAGLVAVLAATARLAVLLRSQGAAPLGNVALMVPAWLALTVVVWAIAASRPGTGIRPLRPVDTILEFVWLLASAAAAVGCALWLAQAVRRSEAGEGRLRLALWPAAGATTAMAVALVAVALLTVQAPTVVGSSVVVLLAMMTVGVVLAGSALRRGWVAARGSRPLQR